MPDEEWKELLYHNLWGKGRDNDVLIEAVEELKKQTAAGVMNKVWNSVQWSENQEGFDLVDTLEELKSCLADVEQEYCGSRED